MKFEEKSFSSRPSSDSYRDGWEATFGKKEKPLCAFELSGRPIFGQSLFGYMATKRCVLPEGHDGNHQLEAV